MILLALETATEACSAALYVDGQVIERYRLAPREHNRLILPMIEDLLAEAGLGLSRLDALAFGRGPGSFTGVRIATGVVQGIAFAADRPIVPVSTLAALALQAFDEDTAADWALPCIDARMGEVYCATYRRSEDGMPMLEGAERVLAPCAIERPVARPSRCLGIGSGWRAYGELLHERIGRDLSGVIANRFPRASHVARLGVCGFEAGGAVAALQALPVYLRDRVTHRPSAAIGESGAAAEVGKCEP